ncbi:MAG TPA: hypothetical protein VGC79_10485 [Polyangiaceae bacterium]
MIGCFALCWLGTGLLLGANVSRMQRLFGRAPTPPVSWLVRAAGVAALAGSAWALRSEVRGALVIVSALLAAMAVASLSSLLAPLRPRLYALTVPVSALIALFAR